MSFRAVLFPWSLSKQEQCVISVKEPSYTTDKIRENTLKFLKEGKKGELGGEKKRSKRNKRKKEVDYVKRQTKCEYVHSQTIQGRPIYLKWISELRCGP